MERLERKAQTTKTYEESADAFAEKFDSLGARLDDVDETFEVLAKANPAVLEIGCGNGRDAVEILKKTKNYIGMDISEGLIRLARQKNPSGVFETADIERYTFPKGLDVIFAFASLLHVPREEFEKILDRAHEALNNNGVFRISLKHSDEYTEETKTDEFGTRTYCLYSESDIQNLARQFDILKNEQHIIRDQVWLEVLLKKS